VREVWLVARREYLHVVGKKSFLIATLAFPALMLLIGGITVIVSLSEDDPAMIGYVDLSGLLRATQIQRQEGFHSYDSVEAGREAVEEGQIDVLMVVPEAYLESRQVRAYYWDEWPGEKVWDRWDGFVRRQLLASVPAAVRQRILGDDHVVIHSADDRSRFDTDNPFTLIVPLLAAMLFMFAALAAGGYLLQAVVEEKENRTIEVLISTIRPEQLIGGKAVGLVGAGLTQVAAWLATAALAIPVGSLFLGPLPPLTVNWQLVLAAVFYFVPALALNGAVMVAIGSAVTEAQQARPLAAPLTLFFILPVMVMPVIFTSPDSPFLLAMTLFPPTSFATIMIRSSVSAIPAWQLILSWLILVTSSALTISLAARIFRRGMLRYGQRLDVRAVWSAIRGRAAEPDVRAD
jgi:ABC-2 type transport system permease protein